MGDKLHPQKYEIVKKTQDMLDLEGVKLFGLADFSRVMTQKFDEVKVKGNNLVLYRGTRERKLKIKKNKALVEKTITSNYASEKLEFEREEIRLSELKSLPCIDFEKQAQLKAYIDDLVFALYFNVPLSKIGIGKAGDIKKACQKNRFYRLVSKGV